MIWSDARAEEETAEIERRIPRDELVAITGNRSNVSFTAPKIMWVARNEPETMARARWIVQPKDALRARLTGEVGGDVSDASATLLFDLRARTWSDDICGRLEIDREQARPALRIGSRWPDSCARTPHARSTFRPGFTWQSAAPTLRPRRSDWAWRARQTRTAPS